MAFFKMYFRGDVTPCTPSSEDTHVVGISAKISLMKAVATEPDICAFLQSISTLKAFSKLRIRLFSKWS